MPPTRIPIVQRCSLSQLSNIVGLRVLLEFWNLSPISIPSASLLHTQYSFPHTFCTSREDKGHSENALLFRLLLENSVGLSEWGDWGMGVTERGCYSAPGVRHWGTGEVR